LVGGRAWKQNVTVPLQRYFGRKVFEFIPRCIIAGAAPGKYISTSAGRKGENPVKENTIVQFFIPVVRDVLLFQRETPANRPSECLFEKIPGQSNRLIEIYIYIFDGVPYTHLRERVPSVVHVGYFVKTFLAKRIEQRYGNSLGGWDGSTYTRHPEFEY